MATKGPQNSLFSTQGRYVKGGATETANNRIEWWERTAFQPDPTDVFYVIADTYDRRPDLVAAIFYNDPRLWWFIAQFNNILDPFSEMTTGKVLRLPTVERASLMLTGKPGGIASKRELTPTISAVIV
jgi:hypothetical protein